MCLFYFWQLVILLILVVQYVGGSKTEGKKQVSHIFIFVAIPTSIALSSLLLLLLLSRSIHMSKRNALETSKGMFTLVLEDNMWMTFEPLIFLSSSTKILTWWLRPRNNTSIYNLSLTALLASLSMKICSGNWWIKNRGILAV